MTPGRRSLPERVGMAAPWELVNAAPRPGEQIVGSLRDTVNLVQAERVLDLTRVTVAGQQGRGIQARLTLSGVVKEALTLYSLEPGRIALTAIATFIPIDLLTVLLHGWSVRFLEVGHTGFSEAAEFIIFLLITAGQVFLAGVLDHLAGMRLDNESAVTLFQVYRRVPLGPLITADLVVSGIASIASLAFVIPGYVAFALFGIVGPVINLEDRDVVDALKRSAALVYPHLFLACVVIALPLTVEIAVEDWYLAFAHSASIVSIVAVSVAFSLTTRALISLLEVVLGRVLIQEDRAFAPAIA